MDDPVGAVAVVGEGEGDVDHGQPGADEQHVTQARAVAAYDVEGAGRPRVGDEERRRGQRRRRPGVSGRGQPRRDDRGVGGDLGAVGGAQCDTGVGAAHPHHLLAHVAYADLAQRTAQCLLEGLVEVARPLPSRGEVVGIGARVGVLTVAPGDEVAGVLGQRGHAGGRDVEQVLVVGRAEGDAACAVVGRVDQHDVDAGAAPRGRAGEVESDERPGGAGAHDRDGGSVGAGAAEVGHVA